MTKAETQLVEFLFAELTKAERILSKLGKKKAVLLSKEDSDQWVTLSFRRRWLLEQIDSFTQNNKK